ncbi:MAG: glycosyltransferase [Planctomycetaceae bacterium]
MIAPRSPMPASLLVFSDDWGRHPSSCQHLIRQLLPHYKVLWVNTIGTRAPRCDLATMKRVLEKVRHWTTARRLTRETAACDLHHNLTVVNPRMWPWFSRGLDRRLNSWLLSGQLNPLIEALPQPVCAVTTLPITADLPGKLSVEKWVYYCVDDFGEWPGLDGETLRRMDGDMVRRADRIVSVSEHLQDMVRAYGRSSNLLTHGVDLEVWHGDHVDISDASPVDLIPGRRIVFWGVVDRRLNSDMLMELSQRLQDGSILLIGPQQDPDERILNLPNVYALGSQPFSALPAIAKRSDVLIMPYADLPVTRAMQPLKLKEYMATGKPVVVSSLPAVADWRDCVDVTLTAKGFADAVLTRLETSTPPSQLTARTRLKRESWHAKAAQLEEVFGMGQQERV